MPKAIALGWVFALLLACRPAEEPTRQDWIIRSRIVFVASDLKTPAEPQPVESFRLWTPLTSGDLYSAPTSGDYLNATVRPDYRFELDLNRGHDALLQSLVQTDFSLNWMRIEPSSARIARISPFLMEADGIEPIGQAQWLDAETHRTLMLVYFDRPARITGQAPSGRIRFDVRAEQAGYVWILEPGADGGEYIAVPKPENLVLAVTPKD